MKRLLHRSVALFLSPILLVDSISASALYRNRTHPFHLPLDCKITEQAIVPTLRTSSSISFSPNLSQELTATAHSSVEEEIRSQEQWLKPLLETIIKLLADIPLAKNSYDLKHQGTILNGTLLELKKEILQRHPTNLDVAGPEIKDSHIRAAVFSWFETHPIPMMAFAPAGAGKARLEGYAGLLRPAIVSALQMVSILHQISPGSLVPVKFINETSALAIDIQPPLELIEAEGTTPLDLSEISGTAPLDATVQYEVSILISEVITQLGALQNRVQVTPSFKQSQNGLRNDTASIVASLRKLEASLEFQDAELQGDSVNKYHLRASVRRRIHATLPQDLSTKQIREKDREALLSFLSQLDENLKSTSQFLLITLRQINRLPVGTPVPVFRSAGRIVSIDVDHVASGSQGQPASKWGQAANPKNIPDRLAALELIAKGFDADAIAKELVISLRDVWKLMRELRAMLNVGKGKLHTKRPALVQAIHRSGKAPKPARQDIDSLVQAVERLDRGQLIVLKAAVEGADSREALCKRTGLQPQTITNRIKAINSLFEQAFGSKLTDFWIAGAILGTQNVRIKCGEFTIQDLEGYMKRPLTHPTIEEDHFVLTGAELIDLVPLLNEVPERLLQPSESNPEQRLVRGSSKKVLARKKGLEEAMVAAKEMATKMRPPVFFRDLIAHFENILQIQTREGSRSPDSAEEAQNHLSDHLKSATRLGRLTRTPIRVPLKEGDWVADNKGDGVIGVVVKAEQSLPPSEGMLYSILMNNRNDQKLELRLKNNRIRLKRLTYLAMIPFILGTAMHVGLLGIAIQKSSQLLLQTIAPESTNFSAWLLTNLFGAYLYLRYSRRIASLQTSA